MLVIQCTIMHNNVFYNYTSLKESYTITFNESITGAIRDSTGSFDIAFHIMGVCLIGAGLIFFTEPVFRKLEENRMKNKT